MASDAAFRTGEYEFFRSRRAAELMAEFGIVPMGVRNWRDRMRGKETIHGQINEV